MRSSSISSRISSRQKLFFDCLTKSHDNAFVFVLIHDIVDIIIKYAINIVAVKTRQIIRAEKKLRRLKFRYYNWDTRNHNSTNSRQLHLLYRGGYEDGDNPSFFYVANAPYERIYKALNEYENDMNKEVGLSRPKLPESLSRFMFVDTETILFELEKIREKYVENILEKKRKDVYRIMSSINICEKKLQELNYVADRYIE